MRCLPAKDDGGTLRCLPPSVDSHSYFDAKCEVGIYSVYDPSGCPGGPPQPTEVTFLGQQVKVSGPVSPTLIYGRDNGVCAGHPLGTFPYRWLKLGERIPSSAYATVAECHD